MFGGGSRRPKGGGEDVDRRASVEKAGRVVVERNGDGMEDGGILKA